MLRLRPYKHCDAGTIVTWVGDERSFRKWCADRYDHYPITAADMIAYYDGFADADWFYPMTAFDEHGLVGHMIMRFTDPEKTNLRFGFVIVDPERRGQGCGKEMLNLALKMAFEIIRTPVVSLGVFDNNPVARRCYESIGFQVDETAELEHLAVFGEDWTCTVMRIDEASVSQ